MKANINIVLSNMLKWAFTIMTHLIPINKKMVLFLSFHGRGFSDNPKAIFLEMQKDARFQDHTFVWAMKKGAMCQIEGATVIPYFTPLYFWYLARSKYWVCNCKLQNYVVKKKQQVYLQTWHGTPLKRLAHDIEVSQSTTFYRSGMNIDQMRKTYDEDVKKYTYMISPNAFCTSVFQSAFKINKERLIETGYPRNDRLSTFTLQDVEAVKEKFHLPHDKKIILYAPTWRDDQFTAAGYTFELKVDFKKWYEQLKEEFIIVYKPHYLIINAVDIPQELQEFVYPIDPKVDIDELYLVADALVTDYSSVFFDYGILRRPIYFYMYDLVEYAENLRGFYLDIYQDLPGKIYTQEDGLLQDLQHLTYDDQHAKTFHELFHHKEDGHASQRVLDILYQRGN